jgi:hypothetical protein
MHVQKKALTVAAILVLACSASQAVITTLTAGTTPGATPQRPPSFLTIAGFDGFDLQLSPALGGAAPRASVQIVNVGFPGFTTSGLSFALATGAPYVPVVTGQENSDLGRYAATVGGPDVVTAVSEPNPHAMVALGLIAVGLSRLRAAPRA